MNLSTPQLTLSLFCLSTFSWATALGDLAATLKPGQWAPLQTANIQATLAGSASSGMITGYADGGAWDPTSQQFLFIGSDHCEIARFACYDAVSNSWRRMAQPSWVGGWCNAMTHGYDHNTINEAAGIYYFRPMSSPTIHAYNIASGAWSTLPANNNIYTGQLGISYFPEARGIFLADMATREAFFWSQSTNQWRTLSGSFAAGSYHSISEYNPVHKILIFGGGNGNRNLYKIDSTLQTISPLANAPAEVTCSGLGSLLTVDPVSGDYLFFTSGGQFHSYKVANNSWTQRPGSNFFDPISGSSNGHVYGVIAAPVASHGVVMFVKANGSSSNVYLYKHSSGTGAEKFMAGQSAGLSVWPSPVTGTAAIRLPRSMAGDEKIRVSIVDLRGRKIAGPEDPLGTGAWTWKTTNLPSGVYVVRARSGGAEWSRAVLVQK